MLSPNKLKGLGMSSSGSVGEHNGRILKLPIQAFVRADNAAGGYVAGESIRREPSKYENERILPQFNGSVAFSMCLHKLCCALCE